MIGRITVLIVPVVGDRHVESRRDGIPGPRPSDLESPVKGVSGIVDGAQDIASDIGASIGYRMSWVFIRYALVSRVELHRLHRVAGLHGISGVVGHRCGKRARRDGI